MIKLAILPCCRLCTGKTERLLNQEDEVVLNARRLGLGPDRRAFRSVPAFSDALRNCAVAV